METVNGFITKNLNLNSTEPDNWRPCPICGGHGYGYIDDHREWHIRCVNCKSETYGYPDNTLAARAWQRKAVIPSIQIQERLF